MVMFEDIAKRAKAASRELANTTAAQRSDALKALAQLSEKDTADILAANRLDIEEGRKAGLDPVRTKILTLSDGDIKAIPPYMEAIAARRDLIGEKVCQNHIEDGLDLERRMVPIGVLAMLFEARPSVIWDTLALCLRNADALLLRPSRYCVHTTEALVGLFRAKLKECGLPEDSVIAACGGSHEDTYELFGLGRYIDVGVVRGGYKAVEAMKREATVPLAICGPGNCHIYVDQSAQPDMAKEIILNSKYERPLACNAIETVLVHKAWAEKHLADLLEVIAAHGIELVGDKRAAAYRPMPLATEYDWSHEFFAPKLAIAVVDSVETAVAHINEYRTPHTECIITDNDASADYFFANTEANAVVRNASTRLIDGTVFGFGGEIGISTEKLPWCGPVATRQLVQEKFFLTGHGNLRK